MSEAVKLAKTSTKGGFTLFWGVAISSIISSVGVMIIAGILQEAEYGLYNIALLAPQLLQITRDLGIEQATIKYTAQYNHENKTQKIKKILISALTFEFFIGIILSLTLFTLSGYLATEIFNRPEITPLIQIASFSIFGNALFKTTDSAFIGYEKMQYHSITLIVQAAFKTILGIILVLSNFGVTGAILGYTIAFTITGIIGLILLYFKIYKNLKNENVKIELRKTLKKMFKFGLPSSAAIILGTLMLYFYNFLIAIYLTDEIVGNYNLARNFAVLVAFFVQPVQVIMFPAFSKIDGKKNPQTLQNVFQYSIKYASLLIVPATFMVMALSGPAVGTLFPGKFSQTPLFLSLYIILYLYTAFGYIIDTNLLKGQGKTDIILKVTVVYAIVGTILSLTLIPIFGVIGLIATMLISYIPHTIISLWWIKKHYSATVDWKSSTKIMIAGIASAIITYMFVYFVTIPNWIKLGIGVLIYFISYLIIAPLIRAINLDDTKNLKEMLKALGPLAPFLNIPLTIIEKIYTTFHKKTK